MKPSDVIVDRKAQSGDMITQKTVLRSYPQPIFDYLFAKLALHLRAKRLQEIFPLCAQPRTGHPLSMAAFCFALRVLDSVRVSVQRDEDMGSREGSPLHLGRCHVSNKNSVNACRLGSCPAAFAKRCAVLWCADVVRATWLWTWLNTPLHSGFENAN